jgi:hypothetical protein
MAASMLLRELYASPRPAKGSVFDSFRSMIRAILVSRRLQCVQDHRVDYHVLPEPILNARGGAAGDSQ